MTKSNFLRCKEGTSPMGQAVQRRTNNNYQACHRLQRLFFFVILFDEEKKQKYINQNCLIFKNNFKQNFFILFWKNQQMIFDLISETKTFIFNLKKLFCFIKKIILVCNHTFKLFNKIKL